MFGRNLRPWKWAWKLFFVFVIKSLYFCNSKLYINKRVFDGVECPYVLKEHILQALFDWIHLGSIPSTSLIQFVFFFFYSLYLWFVLFELRRGFWPVIFEVTNFFFFFFDELKLQISTIINSINLHVDVIRINLCSNLLCIIGPWHLDYWKSKGLNPKSLECRLQNTLNFPK